MVRFVGCGGLAPLLAPDRGMYGSVWSAAFQRCKKWAKILKWRQMRAFSGSVSEWCGRAVASCPAPAAGTAQRPGRNRPDPGRSRASYRLEAERFLPRGRTVPASRPNGSCLARRFLPTVPARRPGRNRLGRAVPAQEPGSNRRTTLGCCTTLVCADASY